MNSFSQVFRSPKFLLFLLLVTTATVISSHYSLDANAYQIIFKDHSSSGWSNLLNETKRYEAFYLVLAKLYSGWPSIIWFATIAVFSVGLKLLLIQHTSRHFYLSVLAYVGFFFVLYDGTVIRASLAIIIAYWGAWFFSQRYYLLAFLLVSIAATCFHYSLAFFFVVVLFKSKRVSLFLIAAYPLLVGLWFLGFDFVSVGGGIVSSLSADFPGINKLRSYLLRVDPNGVPYSLFFLGLYLSSMVIYFFYQRQLTDFERICLNCVFMSFLVLAIFVGATATQNRVSEIFRFGLVFVFPYYFKFISDWLLNKFWSSVVLVIGLIAYFYKFTVIQGLIQL